MLLSQYSILKTDSKAQVTRGYSGKYETSNKHPCCININIYSGLGVTRENGENTELPHKWQPSIRAGRAKYKHLRCSIQFRSEFSKLRWRKVGNSQEKKIRNFSWKRQRVKRKLLLVTRASRDKKPYMSENGKFELWYIDFS